MNTLFRSTISGIFIGIACIVSSHTDYSALLFSIGLIGIVVGEFLLFTGAVGHYNWKIDKMKLSLILLGNFIGASILCVYSYYFLDISKFVEISTIKLQQPLIQFFCSAILCGMLMCIATSLNSEKSLIVVIFCVTSFIIAKFDHCIANMFYFGVNGYSIKEIMYLIINISGNAVGSKITYIISKTESLK